jgi:DNA-binding transcriptional regulator YhcF (GntR family)
MPPALRALSDRRGSAREEPTELHEQVVAEIRRAIAEGEARPGEGLPPARDLAAVLDVNTNTVLRALRQLRDEGLLDFRRGRGITVAATPDYGAVVAAARDLVLLGRRYGYRRDELLEIIERLATRAHWPYWCRTPLCDRTTFELRWKTTPDGVRRLPPRRVDSA